METMITSRHATITDALRERTQERLASLARFEPRIVSAHVCFVSDHGASRAEVRLHGSAGATTLATGSGSSFGAALDAALERVARQLKRRRERLIDRKVVPPAPLP